MITRTDIEYLRGPVAETLRAHGDYAMALNVKNIADRIPYREEQTEPYHGHASGGP